MYSYFTVKKKNIKIWFKGNLGSKQINMFNILKKFQLKIFS